MTISAKVIADSICNAKRITTMELKYPRFIHAELMTHRQFSRNASSSRAIPVTKSIEAILEDTAMPIHWGLNQRGMQAENELDTHYQDIAIQEWVAARDSAIKSAYRMLDLGLHKQVVNRILEPFSHITVLVTSTEWANFFALRDHPDAQPEIQELAKQMKVAIQESEPVELRLGSWHLPYIEKEDPFYVIEHLGFNYTRERLTKLLCGISAARCARVSYLTHDGKRPSIDADIHLYNHLTAANPPHMSPCEHQAMAMEDPNEVCGNFSGWFQFRKTIPNEVTK